MEATNAEEAKEAEEVEDVEEVEKKKRQASGGSPVLGKVSRRGKIVGRGGRFWLVKPRARVAGMRAKCKLECVWTGEDRWEVMGDRWEGIRGVRGEELRS